MTFDLHAKHALLAATLIAAPGAALAQNQVEAQANQVAAEAQDLAQASNELTNTLEAEEQAGDARAADGTGDRDQDDDDFPWGLLGLLGLAGLLGLKGRDRDHHHRVDRDHDRTTTTGGTRTGGPGARL